MAQRDSFSGCHPGLNMLYFAAVLAVTILCAHPVTLAISFGTAGVYCVQLYGWGGFGRRCLWLVPMMAMAALINPLFSHEGATILTCLPSGNPLTLESILYGLAAAVILGAAVLWFGCMTAVLTTDKFVWLFGRLLPALSLLLSMTLRFVPRLVRQFGQVRQAQQCVGRDISRGSVLRRVGSAVAILSITLTWALENAIETADSMNSRGYGLPGRTAFSIYRFDKRDVLVLAWLLLCCGCVAAGWMSGGLTWAYYPVLQGNQAVLVQAAVLALFLTPVILNVREECVWKRLRSEI